MDIPQGQGNIERPHRWLKRQLEKQKGPLNRALFTLNFNCAKDGINRMAQVTWGQGNETWGAIETHHDKKVVWPVPRANVGKRVFLCLPWRCGTANLGTFKAPKSFGCSEVPGCRCEEAEAGAHREPESVALEASRAGSKEEASCTDLKEGDTTNVGSNKKADANVGGGSTRPGVGK